MLRYIEKKDRKEVKIRGKCGERNEYERRKVKRREEEEKKNGNEIDVWKRGSDCVKNIGE